MPLTPRQRALRARQAAYTQWGNTPDPAAHTAPARAAFLAKFEREVDEAHPNLDPAARARMVEAKRKAYFSKMAFEREKARAARKGGGGDGRAA